MYDENSNDHDLSITRYSRRDRPYYVWVKVTSYCPGEAMTYDHPGCGSEVEDADAWTTMGDEIELTRDELDEVTKLWDTLQSENAADAEADYYHD